MADFAMMQTPLLASPTAATADLPASARRVLDVLGAAGAMTHTQLVAATQLPARTIRFAVRRLRDAGLVESMPSLRDCRTRFVYLKMDRIEPAASEGPSRRRAEEHLQSVRALLMP